MNVARSPAGREEVIFFNDRETGLRGITVLDDTSLGPAVGVCRSRPYDDEERALADALRQARKTTHKAVAAGLPVGGGCTVLLKETERTCPTSQLRALGRAIEELTGRYYLMPDLGNDAADMDLVAEETAYVLGRSRAGQMEPADALATGVMRGMSAAVRHKLGRDSFRGLRIAIMGLGPAGYRLAELLRQEGARLTVADRDPRRTERTVRELGIACVATEEIVHLDTDVFAPCASHHVINDDTLAHLRCRIVAGIADHPLEGAVHGEGLHERDILYAPDSVIAAGDLISLVQPLLAESADRPPVERQIAAIDDRLTALFEAAASDNQPTSVVAERLWPLPTFCRNDTSDLDGFALTG
jgi:leucine dehydrogenase